MCIMYTWPKLTQKVNRLGGGAVRVGKTENMWIKTVTSANLHFPVTVLIKNVRKYVAV